MAGPDPAIQPDAPPNRWCGRATPCRACWFGIACWVAGSSPVLTPERCVSLASTLAAAVGGCGGWRARRM